MRKVSVLFLVAALFAAVSLPALQSQPQQPPKEKKKPRKVWTEDDLAGLSGRINVVGVEAPPPAEPKAAPAEAQGPGFPWEELDDLTARRSDLERVLGIGRQQLERMNNDLHATNDPVEIETLLNAREAQEAAIAQREEELAATIARIAELEKQTKGRKRPPKPAQTEKARPAQEGEEAAPGASPEAPEEESPKEEPPPPPPPPLT
ncbi:MAG: hypothetical protein ACRD4U_11110 [Candidatus Acidiferrales bacterium]